MGRRLSVHKSDTYGDDRPGDVIVPFLGAWRDEKLLSVAIRFTQYRLFSTRTVSVAV